MAVQSNIGSPVVASNPVEAMPPTSKITGLLVVPVVTSELSAAAVVLDEDSGAGAGAVVPMPVVLVSPVELVLESDPDPAGGTALHAVAPTTMASTLTLRLIVGGSWPLPGPGFASTTERGIEGASGRGRGSASEGQTATLGNACALPADEGRGIGGEFGVGTLRSIPRAGPEPCSRCAAPQAARFALHGGAPHRQVQRSLAHRRGQQLREQRRDEVVP